jgi:vitamin B12 transporter
VRLVFFICLLAICFGVSAQTDTLILDNVVVTATPWHNYALGLKVEKFTDIGALGTSQNIGAALFTSSPIYIKSYGAGQISTIGFRGTSASQNALFWNGINVNGTSLGLSDLSLTPLALVDEVALQYGAASSLLGSDVVGGSIHLNSAPTNENRFTIGVGAGSYGAYNSTVSGKVNIGKLNLSTKFIRQTAENNFSYKNTSKAGHPLENMEHAGFSQVGISQDAWLQLNERNQLSLHLWYSFMDRDVQPAIGTANTDTQQDANKRILLTHELNGRDYITTFKLAYLQDRIDFNGDLSIMPRWYASFEVEIPQKGFIKHKIGANAQLLQAKIDAYNGDISEQRMDVYYAGSMSFSAKAAASLTLRQSFVEGFEPPITPSLGGQIKIANYWIAKANISRSYRVATLNDRYWRPGGNPDLQPESGYHGETTWMYSKSKKLTAEATLFGGKVSEWILWTPENNIWTPKNIDEVFMYGVEAQVGSDITTNLKIQMNYAYNRSVRNNTISDDFEGKQLPYTPIHQLKSAIKYHRGVLHIAVRPTLVGARFTSADNSTQLPTFFILAASVQANLNTGWLLSLNAENLTNSNYQLVENRAMPRSIFNFSIQKTFIKNSK